MIGLFDSGHGGLTVLRTLAQRFPDQALLYYGDHANAPYGDRPAGDVVRLTQDGVTHLFDLGCRLVLLACNTATAVACRTLQQNWLPASHYADRNVLGIVAPTVEAATQVPWAVTTPQYPQKYNAETIGVFGTRRTVVSNVYPEEIGKRCPQVTVVQQACPTLVQGIEGGWLESELSDRVAFYVQELLAQTPASVPERVILGCTHYPLLEHLFRERLPEGTRVLGQPHAVADSLEDYLTRHPQYVTPSASVRSRVRLMTSGDPVSVSRTLSRFWPEAPSFESIVVPSEPE